MGNYTGLSGFFYVNPEMFFVLLNIFADKDEIILTKWVFPFIYFEIPWKWYIDNVFLQLFYSP